MPPSFKQNLTQIVTESSRKHFSNMSKGKVRKTMKKQQKRVRFSHIIGITFFLIILIGLLPLKLKGNNLGEVYAKTNQKN